jgi:alkanesulfonate monooxygenase SsuD/methylene tetrahydromethanopterin reductase-like flavin-dependent oxidoreductase (luciferase family)
VLIDLAINPFDAHVPDMVELARAAESLGCSAVWVADHFGAAMVGRRWSRDPFVCLGAIAAATQHVDVGVLVANVVNRHPAQLASAVNSLQSLAPGRVRLGLGSGAAPGSRFAAEHETIGRTLVTSEQRCAMLVEHLSALRSLWGEDDVTGVVDDAAAPSIIIGASSWPTMQIAIDHADGVNIRHTPLLGEHLRRLAGARPAGFEVSVLDDIDSILGRTRVIVAEGDPGQVGVELAGVELAGVDRLVVGVSPPHRPDRLDALVDLVHRLRRPADSGS